MDINKPLNFIFFGIAGSGKGTQVELLQNYIKNKNISNDILYVYPGNEFRKLSSGDSYTGSYIKNIIEAGGLVPSFITDSLVTNMFTVNIKQDSVVITDGYPRTIEQSQTFEKLMNFYKRENITVIYIEVGRDEAIKRMKLRARNDDTDEGIAKRFDEYVNNVLPSMDYFKDKTGYNLFTINGEQSIEEVHNEIISKLGL